MTTWTLDDRPWLPTGLDVGYGSRVIIDNDFAGDPDDFFALVHHLLTPEVQIRAIICSHLPQANIHDDSGLTALHGMEKVRDLLSVMRLDTNCTNLLKVGSEHALADPYTPRPSEASEAIIAEAMRDDTDLPLFYAAGGGLTDLASAYLACPAIAERMAVIWIGGREYPQLCGTATVMDAKEYNAQIDPVAMRLVLSDSALNLWQVPRDAYRQCCVSVQELWQRIGVCGSLGTWLWNSLHAMRSMGASAGLHSSGVYCLGDQPLVTLSALRTPWDPAPASCSWADIPAPQFDGDDRPTVGSSRIIHVVTQLDTALTFNDFYAKVALFAQRSI